MEYDRLDLKGGDYRLVFPPSMAKYPLIFAHYQEFRRSLEGLPVWPTGIDEHLYPRLRVHYQKIGRLLGFDSDRLIPESRHEFFVATEPVVVPAIAPDPIPGLSGLERLLGLSYPEETEAKADKVMITSGSVDIDLLVDLVLLFKENAQWIYRQFPREFVAKAIKQGSDRLRGEDAIKELQKQKDTEYTEQNYSAIAAQMRLRGIPVPEEN